nr:MAG TPA: IBR domain, a half RING-finger domain [Caudoviricetes sp.]
MRCGSCHLDFCLTCGNVIDNITALQSQNELLALMMLFLMGFEYISIDS